MSSQRFAPKQELTIPSALLAFFLLVIAVIIYSPLFIWEEVKRR